MDAILLIFISVFSLTVLTSCAPKQQEREYENTAVSFKPRLKDVSLPLDQSPYYSQKAVPVLKWQGEVDTAIYLNLSDDLMSLGQSSRWVSLANLGVQLHDGLYSSKGTTTEVKFSDSPYVEAAIGETEDSSLKEIKSASDMLVSQNKVITELLDKDVMSYPWPSGRMALRTGYREARKYLQHFKMVLMQKEIDPRVRVTLTQEIEKSESTTLAKLEARITSIESATGLEVVLQSIETTMSDFQATLGTEQAAQLKFGHTLAELLKNAKDEQDLLSIIIVIWEQLTPLDRETIIKPKSAELYEYLNGRDASDMECLKDRDCFFGGVMVKIAKQWKIFPAIKEYGVDKARIDIDKASRDEAVAAIEAVVAEQIPTLPKLLREQVEKGIAEFVTKLQKISSNYPLFLKTAMQSWSQKQFEDDVSLKAVETSRISLDWKPQSISLSAKTSQRNPEDPIVYAQAQVMGASLAAGAQRLMTEESLASWNNNQYRRVALENINRMLVLGGYHRPGGQLAPSYAMAINSQYPGFSRMDLHRMLDVDLYFAMPDRVVLDGPIQRKLGPSQKDISIQSQAELLRGLSLMIRYLRDWETNAYDHTLGKVSIADYITDLPASEVNRALFPKEMMFSMAVANSAAILVNILKELTPVFLLSTQSRLIWANEFNFDQSHEDTTTMAGVVSLAGGVRAPVVASRDVAKYILALTEFLRSSEGLDKTKSPVLREGADKGKGTPVDTLVEARGKLRLLLLGLSNFLVHRMMSEDGGVITEFDLKTMKASTATRQFVDQIMVMRALNESGQFLGLSLYQARAIDIYYFLNQKFFRPELGFWSQSESQAIALSPMELVSGLRAFVEIRSWLPEESQNQMDRVLNVWGEAINHLSETTMIKQK